MKLLYKVMIIAAIAIIGLVIWQFFYLKKAHSTFENYYAFRGCKQLIEKTDNFGRCKLRGDKVIKIVKYQNKWFLDGDLPSGFLSW